nr:MAG TPA: hypothetical protein [Caudoviricetes sp.]
MEATNGRPEERYFPIESRSNCTIIKWKGVITLCKYKY